MRAAAWPFLVLVPCLAWPSAAPAQRLNGTLAGTLDCPARSLFDSGSTPVRGRVRNDEVSVNLGGVTVSGRVVTLGARAVRLSGTGAGGAVAVFDGVFVTPTQLHARGTVEERPCNLNLVLNGGPDPGPAPAPQAAAPQVQPQPASVLSRLDGPWSGSISCPTSSLMGSGLLPAEGSIVDGVLTLNFANVEAKGRIVRLSPNPQLRLDGDLTSFDATQVTAQSIRARGLFNGQPCTLTLTPARQAPPPSVEAVRTPPPLPPIRPNDGKPPPSVGTTPVVPPPAPPLPLPQTARSGEKPPPAPPIPESMQEPDRAPPPPPPVAALPPPRSQNQTPPPPAPPPAPPPPAPPVATAPPPAPAPAPPRAPTPEAAQQLACALAGTCPPPGTPPR